VYDPGTGQWTITVPMKWARIHHPAATLLVGGQVLITGGGNARAEVFEDLESRQEWRPVFDGPGPTLSRKASVRISGSRLRALSEASSGNSQSSATDLPLVSLVAVEGGALTRVPYQGSFSGDEMSLSLDLTVPATVPDGHYILSVMTHATHSGQMVRVDGPAMAETRITNPGTLISDKQPLIDGKAEPGSTVMIWLDEQTIETVETDSNGDWKSKIGLDLADGDHQIKAIARDQAGNVGPGANHGFTVDTLEPAKPEVKTPGSSASTSKPVISGTAEPGSTVQVWLDGKALDSIQADGRGDWFLPLRQELAAGEHQVRAQARDRAGNDSEPSDTHHFIIQRSHYGWSCATAPASPAAWAWLALVLLLGRRRFGAPGA
jgi:MYXO-CTERM domain-containing protein